MSDAHSEPSQKKKWVKRILLILLILLLVITLGIGFFIWRAGHTWDSKTEKFDSITKVDEDLSKIKEQLGEAKKLNVTELKARPSPTRIPARTAPMLLRLLQLTRAITIRTATASWMTVTATMS